MPCHYLLHMWGPVPTLSVSWNRPWPPITLVAHYTFYPSILQTNYVEYVSLSADHAFTSWILNVPLSFVAFATSWTRGLPTSHTRGLLGGNWGQSCECIIRSLYGGYRHDYSFALNCSSFLIEICFFKLVVLCKLSVKVDVGKKLGLGKYENRLKLITIWIYIILLMILLLFWGWYFVKNF